MTSGTAPADSTGIWTTIREAPVPVKALLVGVFVNKLGWFLQVFLVLFLTTSKGFTDVQAGTALGVYGGGSVIGLIIGGSLSDKVGSRAAVMISMFGMAAFVLGIAYVPSYATVLVVVALAGAVGQFYRPASAALLTELTPKSRQVMTFALYRLAMNVGTTAAPLIGAALVAISWNLLFIGEALAALAYAAVAIIALPGRKVAEPVVAVEEQPGGGYLAVLRDYKYLLFLACMFINAAIYLQYLAVLPLHMKSEGLSTWWFSAVVALNGFIVITCELLVTRVVQHWPARIVAMIGFALLGGGLAFYALPGGIAIFVIGTLLWTLAEIIAGPTMFAYPGMAARPKLLGRYVGSAHAMFGLGSAVGPFLGVWLWNNVGAQVWVWCGVAGGLGVVCAYFGMSSGGNYAIIVDPLSTGQEYPAAFKEAGRVPVAVLSGLEPPPAYRTSWHPEDFEHVHYFTGDLEALAEELRVYEPEYLVPGAESGVELCDQLIEILVPGTGNVPALAAARRDKWQMAQALSAAGVPRLRQFLTSEPAEAERWLKENDLLGKRLVIKPAKAVAGDDVYIVFEDGDWRERFDRVLGRTNKLGLTNDAVLIQEYAEGTEYLVDSYSVDGVHSLVDVCRYTKVSRGDKIGIYHRIDFLAPDDPEVLVLWPYTQQVLDAVGIRIGCGHSEIMLTPDGPRLIEVAARPAGGGHQMVSELAVGDNHIKRTVAHRVRGEVRSTFDLVQHVRGVFISAVREGYFRNREVLAPAEDLESFHWMKILHDEDAIVPETVDLFTCLAWVILIHSDPATLDNDYHRLREMEAAILIQPPG